MNICYSAPNSLSHCRGTQVHGVHQSASHIPALNLPSRSWYSFTGRLRMEGWIRYKPRPRVQRATGPRLLCDHLRPARFEPQSSDRKSSTLTTRLSRHQDSTTCPYCNCAEEAAWHLILQCPTLVQIRQETRPDLQISSYQLERIGAVNSTRDQGWEGATTDSGSPWKRPLKRCMCVYCYTVCLSL